MPAVRVAAHQPLLGLCPAPAAQRGEAPATREAMMVRLDYWHTMLSAMGSRKLTVKLREEGFPAGRKLVRRLMQEMGIWTIYPKANLSKRNFQEAIAPYLLRNKTISFPNQVWSIDITYIKLHRSHMYLTAIIDWYSRKIVGWNLFRYPGCTARSGGGTGRCGPIWRTGDP